MEHWEQNICRIYTEISPNNSQSTHNAVMNQTTENDSFFGANLTLKEQILPHALNHYVSFQWFEIVIPIVCMFGIVGNILNLAVLTRNRHVSGMDSLGKTANCGLVALAFSDLLFCLTVLPFTFIPSITAIFPELKPLVLYYKLYGSALINLFIMVSTWLIVTMAIKRYLVVVNPLHAREIITLRRTYCLIVLVYTLSAIITLPYFLRLVVEKCHARDGRTEYELRPRWSQESTVVLTFYTRWIWPLIADFVPILILIVCNYHLIRELNLAKASRQNSCPGQNVRDSGQKTTLILVIIVLMLLLLVSPSEILKYINPYRAWGRSGYVVASVANVMQTINFAVNFLLYFIISAKFRNTARLLLYSRCSKKQNIDADFAMGTMLPRNCSVKTNRSWFQNSYGTNV